jgi:cytochrome P450
LSAFIPPFPARLPSEPSIWQRIRTGRSNLLAFWEDEAFEYEFVATRLLTRRIFLCNSPDAVQFAFSTHNQSFERKSPQHRHALQPLLGDGLFVSDGKTWAARRRIVAPIVHVSRLAEFAPVMVETANEARARWAGLPPGTRIDALGEMARLAAEIICRTIFGRELGREHAGAVVEGFSEYQRLIGQLDLLSFFGAPDWFPRWRGPALHRAVRRIHGVLDGIIASCRAQSDREQSVIGRLLDARDEETGEPLSEEALRNEAAVLFMAGHETTANSLAWTWYLLSQTPDVETRLHDELDTVLGGRTPTLADVGRLAYTRAVFEEAMRLYPPVPFLSREALREETFRERRIPKGSIILVSPWLLHRHRKFWRDPDRFIPDRFMPGGKEPVSKFAYIPFSIGPRICAGMSFGLTEAILGLATLAQSFSLRLVPGHIVEPVCRLTLRPEGGLPMTLHARASPHKAASVPPTEATPGCPFGHG